MRKSIVFVLLSVSMIAALLAVARENATPPLQSSTIYSTNFNSGYSGWTASVGVASVAPLHSAKLRAI